MLEGRELSVLLALVEQHRTEGRATVDSVAERAGYCKVVTWRTLRALRDGGWVGFEDHHHGTLHPKVRRVL